MYMQVHGQSMMINSVLNTLYGHIDHRYYTEIFPYPDGNLGTMTDVFNLDSESPVQSSPESRVQVLQQSESMCIELHYVYTCD